MVVLEIDIHEITCSAPRVNARRARIGMSIPQDLKREIDGWGARSMVELCIGSPRPGRWLGIEHYRKWVGDPDRMSCKGLDIQSMKRRRGLAIAAAMGAAQLGCFVVHRPWHGVAIRHG